MTLESSATIMDAIFASPEEEGRGRLLKIMQEFLVSESSKHSAKEKGMCLCTPSLPFIQPFLLCSQKIQGGSLRTSTWKNWLETQMDLRILGEHVRQMRL